MSEILCTLCEKECYVVREMSKLQSLVPRKIATDEDLEKVGRLMSEEQQLHRIGRERNCLQHNGQTLNLPPYGKK